MLKTVLWPKPSSHTCQTDKEKNLIQSFVNLLKHSLNQLIKTALTLCKLLLDCKQ